MVRIAAGVQQKDLAKMLHVPAPLLSMYEKGRREPPLDFLQTFAEQFHMSLAQLFSLIDHTTENEDDPTAMIREIKALTMSLEKSQLKKKRSRTK